MNSRQSTAARCAIAALAAFALVVVPLAIYVAGYLGLGRWHEGYAPKAEVQFIERVYPQPWMKTAFRPAANTEAWLRGIEVQVTCTDDHWHEAERAWPAGTNP